MQGESAVVEYPSGFSLCSLLAYAGYIQPFYRNMYLRLKFSVYPGFSLEYLLQRFVEQ